MGLHLGTSSPPKGPTSKYHHFGKEFSAYELEGDTNIQCIMFENQRKHQGTRTQPRGLGTTFSGPPWNNSVLFLFPNGSLEVKIPNKQI